MQICVITTTRIGNSQGTGALLVRLLADHPQEDLCGVCCNVVEDQSFCKTYEGILGLRSMHGILHRFARGRIRYAVRDFIKYLRYQNMRIALQRFRPDLLLIVPAHSSYEIAEQIMKIFPDLPAVCLVWDLLLDVHPSQTRRAKLMASEVLRKADHIEVISEEMVEPVAALSGRTPQVQNFFCCRLPVVSKTDHPSIEQGVQPVLLGSFWYPHMLHLVVEMIRAARQQDSRIKPALWYCHPESLRRIRHTPDSLPDGILYGGHYTGEKLDQHLCEGDLVIVPFNGFDEPEADFARYSIPSRISEICANGLPIFMIAGRNTAVARYVERKQCAVVSSPCNHEQMCRDFVELAVDREKRQNLGRKARLLAESEFDITVVRQNLFARLEQFVGKK